MLSNQTGTLRENIGLDGKGTLFLSQEFLDSPDGVESFFTENGVLKQMVSDQQDDCKS